MNKLRLIFFMRMFLALVLMAGLLMSATDQPVRADGYVGFEEGIDGEVIRNTIPGLSFTNTNGYDWVYADWRTARYNGKYPNGVYTSNGNFFAWLGSTQGSGRIDFINQDATYLSLWVSTDVAVTLKGYNSLGIEIASVTVDTPNTNTGRMDNLTITAPLFLKFSYAIISGTANYWLVDDISTDAGGVPTREPVVFIPGVAGSELKSGSNEVWPNFGSLILPGEDSFLRDLKLEPDGSTDLDPSKPITVGDVLREVTALKQIYKPILEFLKTRGYVEGEDLIVCPYDWRKDLNEISYGTTLTNTLDACIKNAQKGDDTKKVTIIAHSMGGLISRIYIDDSERAKKVDKLITMGTPFLGSPKVVQFILDDTGCFVDGLFGGCFSSEKTVHEIIQNFPAAYQLAPGKDYFSVYPNGYIRIDYDKNGDGTIDGNLDLTQSFAMLENHNKDLVKLTEETQSTIANGLNDGQNNGVSIFAIVGDQLWTPVTLVQYEAPNLNPFAPKEYKYRVEKIDGVDSGDGTVPLHSADMRNLDIGQNLSGNATVFYFKSEHGDLPKKNEVQQLVYDILVTPSTAALMAQFEGLSKPSLDNIQNIQSDPSNSLLLQSVQKAQQPEALEVPRTEPLPLTGRLIAVLGDAELRITDSSGNVIGYDSIQHTNEDLMANANLVKAGDTTYIYLPDSDTYTVEVLGKQTAFAEVSIQQIISGKIMQTALYNDLPITGSSNARLSYDPFSTPDAFQLDQDGDGIVEGVSVSPVILNEVESMDNTAPITSITLEGTKLPTGLYTGIVKVTLSAIDNDGGTGVNQIEYSLDLGITQLIYSAPFFVDAKQVSVLTARASDIAGNVENPVVYKVIGGIRTFIPAMNK